MNARLKILLLLAFSSFMLVTTNDMILRISVIFIVSLVFIYRVHYKLFEWIRPMILVFVLIIFIQYATFPGGAFTTTGLYWGFVFSLRLFTMIAAVFLLVYTTPMSKLAEAFSFLPGSLSQIFVLSLALVPGVGDLAGNIVRSQKSRGMNFRSPNIFTTYMPVLVPLFGKTLYKSEKMSLAMQARGYGKD